MTESLELTSDLLSLVLWLFAGLLVVDGFASGFRWQWVVLALAALTVLRIVPVAPFFADAPYAPPVVHDMAREIGGKPDDISRTLRRAAQLGRVIQVSKNRFVEPGPLAGRQRQVARHARAR